MDTNKVSRIIAIITTGLLLVGLFWLINANRLNGSLNEKLEKESLHSESLLSEKLLLEKDMQKINHQVLSLKDEIRQLENRYQSAAKALEDQQADYNKMKRAYASLNQIKNERADLIALQSKLEKKIQALEMDKAVVDGQNDDLESTVAMLQERNKLLTEDLKRAMSAAVDQSMVDAVRGKKEKLTVKASRTGKLIATFDLPADYKNLSYRILDPNGNILSFNDGSVSSTTAPSQDSYTASSQTTVEPSKLQRVRMAFTPKKKLKTGVYRVEILNENLYVGSLRVNLK